MSDSFLTRNSQIAMPEVREQSASVIQIEQSKSLMAICCILAAASVIAVAVSFHALGRAEQAVQEANSIREQTIEEGRKLRIETRILEDDTKYVRAYLSARGIQIPANHEEAEEGIEK